jgi:hypothetical protein
VEVQLRHHLPGSTRRVATRALNPQQQQQTASSFKPSLLLYRWPKNDIVGRFETVARRKLHKQQNRTHLAF